MVGIFNVTAVTMKNITDIANVSSLPEFFINVNNAIYGGWFWFIMLSILGIILFVSANKVRDQPLNNAMYAGAALTILSFLLRGINVVQNGIVKGMISDYQLWIFPVITIILAIIIWSGKD